MRNAVRLTIITLSVVVLAACQRGEPGANESLNVDSNMSADQLPPGADIETLPADESSTTPSNQLQNGYDSPEANELDNSH